MEKLKVGVVGLGGRGYGMMGTLLDMDDIQVVAVCDVYKDRVQKAVEKVETYGNTPKSYSDYRELVKDCDVEVVFVFTAWEAHTKVAIAAMNAGKQTAIEVGGASSIQECWDLVHTSERTGIQCSLLENCCYGRDEMTILNMVKLGLFGELIHCQGGYEHDLRDEIALGHENRHYRFDNYLARDCENYPTHELGPIAKYLDINNGNRMLSLVSMSSKARGLHEWIVENKGADHEHSKLNFNQGDIVTTLIKCANGETITLTLDTTLPRPYSRGGRVQGTKGLWMEDNNSCFFEGTGEGASYAHKWLGFDDYREKYEHPLWKKFRAEGVKGGHDGMDYLSLRSYIESVQNNTTPPMDVYDAASWMAITCLSEQSIAMGSMPVDIPDFTNSKWIKKREVVRSMYCLDEVCNELFDNENN